MRLVFLSTQKYYFILNSYIKLQVSTCLDRLQEMSILRTQEGSKPDGELCLLFTLQVSKTAKMPTVLAMGLYRCFANGGASVVPTMLVN